MNTWLEGLRQDGCWPSSSIGMKTINQKTFPLISVPVLRSWQACVSRNRAGIAGSQSRWSGAFIVPPTPVAFLLLTSQSGIYGGRAAHQQGSFPPGVIFRAAQQRLGGEEPWLQLGKRLSPFPSLCPPHGRTLLTLPHLCVSIWQSLPLVEQHLKSTRKFKKAPNKPVFLFTYAGCRMNRVIQD